MKITKCDHCGKVFDGYNDFLEVNLKNVRDFLVYHSHSNDNPQPKHFCGHNCIAGYYASEVERTNGIMESIYNSN